MTTLNGRGRFEVMRSRAPGDAPNDPRYALLPVGSGKALATGMTKAVADDIAGALAMAVDSTDADRVGAEAIREHLDASGRVAVGPIEGRERAGFMVTMADGHRFLLRVRLVDLVDPPRLLPPTPPPANTWGKWDIIGPDLRRMAVPGGWLYQAGGPNTPPGPLTFVPNPDHPTGPVDKR